MSKIKYNKEDLLWEATRRNEEYKASYHQLRIDQPDTIDKWKRLWHPYVNYRWRITGAIDPSISAKEIQERVDFGAKLSEVHPYYKVFQDERRPVVHHKIPDILYHVSEGASKSSFKLDYAKIEQPMYRWLKELLAQAKNRIIITINPLVKEKEIIKEVKMIRDESLKTIKAEIENSESGDRNYHPRNIGKYIGWLNKYDKVVNQLKEKLEGKSLTIDKSVVRIPDNFSFTELVPNDTPAEKFEGQRRAWRNAYHEAVSLIQNSPHISFPPAKTKHTESTTR